MRDIRFRGKRLDNGKWVEGDLITKPIHHECVILEHGCINYAVDPSTVGQFTGTSDETGCDVWEDDIVKYHFKKRYRRYNDTVWEVVDDRTLHAQICYYYGGFVLWGIEGYTDIRRAFHYGNRIVEKSHATNGELECIYDQFEVVGNIHDNPDLLEVVLQHG